MLIDTTAENRTLQGLLSQEKRNRKTELDDSIYNEEKADAEIEMLKSKLEILKNNSEELKMEIDSRDAIINLLQNDAQLTTNKISELESELTLLKKYSTEFQSPKLASKYFRTSSHSEIKTLNRFSVLDENAESPLSQPIVGRIFHVQAHVHRRASNSSTAQPSQNVLSSAPLKNSNRKKIVVLADSQGLCIARGEVETSHREWDEVHKGLDKDRLCVYYGRHQ
ncbi:hypothetical protein LSTR_LSTR002972 [Laodelphax striatellus]|uniref:Uncharacterized protein n=1 Tax=Laodelphax striatellus TaxID=195883 RepID=A0A482WSW7_LAOST|nr:hypothetical protein LSTR_LSTR002972 [Laodelphax striatellus]